MDLELSCNRRGMKAHDASTATAIHNLEACLDFAATESTDGASVAGARFVEPFTLACKP